jgi:hypothetical protein
LLGAVGDGERAIARVRVLDPGLRLSNVHMVQAMRPEDLSRWRTGLAKAGLPQ